MLRMENFQELLCARQKLERDKGVAVLEKVLPAMSESHQIDEVVHQLIQLLSAPAESWESVQGGLLGMKVAIDIINDVHLMRFCHEIQEYCLGFLIHDECRVRLAAGELLGSLCQKFGLDVYISSKEQILKLIQENMERHIPGDSSTDFNRKSDESLYNVRRSSSSEIFHDTAGWKFLETSMKCLQFMVIGCGCLFQDMIDHELLNLLFVALKHSNRFVRETGYYVLGSLISCFSDSNLDCSNSVSEHPIFLQPGSELSYHLGIGLADNWSQVRLAASEATRKFLLGIQSNESRDKILSYLLPRMCLNRYYVAEGVRLYSQETWRLVAGTEGKELVEKFIKPVVEFYMTETQADNHAVREAACTCIAELGSKIQPTVIEPYVEQLLKALLLSFQDDSWPVRDAACLASGNFIKCFPDHSRPSMGELYGYFFGNLQDPISSVRQGAAIALANVAKAYGQETLQILEEKLLSGLGNVKNQPVESEKYAGLDKGVSQFSVIKKLRSNDMDLHTDQQMYSCGSLAPKMHRGGGCMDHRFRKQSEPWEMTDGCVNLVAELSFVDEAKPLVIKALPIMSNAVSHSHYTHHVILLETVCKQLPVIAKNLGKRLFKQYLECFLNSIFYSLQVDNALTKAAAESCLIELGKYIGPGILRGRIECHNPSNLPLLDHFVLH